MKKCPKCNNTFEDNLRFCQNDGTPLAEETPLDPYQTQVVTSKPAEDEPLQIPDFDPNKTSVFSSQDEADVLSTPPPPSFGDLGSLPTPELETFTPPPPPDSYTPPPISQPENQPIPTPSQPPPFAEVEQVYQPPPSPFDSPFTPPQQQAGASRDWNPSPAATAPMGTYGTNLPATTAQGENKTLAIVSMVCGILSLLCIASVLSGPIAAITGFIAKGKADSDPQNYGGRGMALAGIIMGIIGTLFGLGITLLGILFWLPRLLR